MAIPPDAIFINKEGAVQGPPGPRGITPRGAWSSTASYVLDDTVSHNGAQWRALRASTNIAPVEGLDWTLFVARGDTGATGATGPTGPTGPQGLRGITPRGAWSSTASYVLDDTVTHNGAQWRALRANTNVVPVEGLDWTLFAAKGEVGATGATGPAGPPGPRGLTHRGAWSSTASYVLDDAVSHNGSSWRALRASTNVTPVEGLDWTILAEKGAAGSAATTTALGTVKVSTAPADAANPIAVSDTDPRNTNPRTPTTHAASHASGGADALAVDAASGTGSLRTLGTGAQQAAPGNDARFATYYKFFRAGSTASPITGVGWEPVFEARTLREVRVRFNVAPTVDTTVVVQRSVGGAAPTDVASVSVAANALQTVLSALSVALAAGDALRVSVTVGGTGGSDMTVVSRAA